NGGITPQSKDPAGLGKQTIGARTVACLEWPAHITKPIQTNFPCGHWDLYPTLLDIVGVKVAKQPPLDGISLLPLFDGKMTERPKPMGFMLRTEKKKAAEKRGEKLGKLADSDFVADTRGVW